MYLVDSFLSILPGQGARAYAALGALAAQVEREQPDAWMYLIHTPNLDPGVNTFPMPGPQQVAFVEGYKDREAFHRHHNSPVMKEHFARNGSCFLNMYGPDVPWMMVQTLERVDGFIRPGADTMTAWQVEARWVMKPGCRDRVREALKGYVSRVYTEEPTTLMYTVSLADTSEQSMALPPSQRDALVFNSSWTDQQAFFEHGSGAPYQDFLNEHGDLFVQASPGSTTHPYMTTSVLSRFAGFFRKEAFLQQDGGSPVA
jgi:quinol monooxygenase YgiN